MPPDLSQMSDEQLDAAIAQHQQAPAQSAPSDFSHLSDEELDQQIAAHQQAPETQPDAPRTWGDTAVDYGKELATGVQNLGNMITPWGQLDDIGSHYLGYKSQSDRANDVRKQIIGDPEYKGAGPLERIGGGAVRGLPMAVAAPETTLLGALSAAGSGAGGQAAKELGYPEWVGNVIGGTAPASMFGSAKALVAPLSTEEEAIRSLGVTKGMIKAANKYGSKDPTEIPKLEQAINGAQDRGLFSGKTDPVSLLEKNQNKISELNDEASSLVGQAKAKSKGPIEPDYKNTKKFLADNNLEPELAAEFEAKKDLINQNAGGDLEKLQAQKSKLGRIGYTGSVSSTVPKLYRVMGHDIKQTIKSQIGDALGEDAAQRFEDLHAQQSEHLALQPVLENAKLTAAKEGIAPAKHSFTSMVGALKELGTAAGAGAAVHYSAPGVNPLLGVGLYAAAHGGKALLNTEAAKAALRGLVGNTSSPMTTALMKAAGPTVANIMTSGTSHVPKSESQLPPALQSNIDQSSSSPMINALASNSTPKAKTERDISTEGLSKKRALALVKSLKKPGAAMQKALAMADAGGVGVYDDGK